MAPNYPVSGGDVCYSAPYLQFQNLKNFPPAVTWCLKYTQPAWAPGKAPDCPQGNPLCTWYSQLEQCAENVASTAWYVVTNFLEELMNVLTISQLLHRARTYPDRQCSAIYSSPDHAKVQ